MATNKQSTYWFTNVICTVLFCAFTFLYLYFFQADVMAYSQHVLSEGQTTYNSLVGAVIITSILMFVSAVTSLFTRRHAYFLSALYHLPAALLLATFTDISIAEPGTKNIIGNTWMVCIGVFVVFVVFCQMLRRFILPGAISGMMQMMRNLTLNLAILLAMMLFVFGSGNTDEQTHLALHSECLLRDNRFVEAANVGMKQQTCNDALLTTRAYAMAKSNLLGEDFFENCCNSTSECLLPSEKNPLQLFPVQRIYNMLGAVKPADMPVSEYLRLLHKRGQLKEGGRDYLYIAALLDCDLDRFVKYYAERYDSTTVVPKHYREALTLYNHLHSAPEIDYSVPEMEADYDDFQALIKKNPDKTKRDNVLRDNYGNTYWYYFYRGTAYRKRSSR